MIDDESPFKYEDAPEQVTPNIPTMRLQDLVLTAIAMRKGVVLAYQFLPKDVAADVLRERIKELTGVDESQMGSGDDVEDAIQDD